MKMYMIGMPYIMICCVRYMGLLLSKADSGMFLRMS